MKERLVAMRHCEEDEVVTSGNSVFGYRLAVMVVVERNTRDMFGNQGMTSLESLSIRRGVVVKRLVAVEQSGTGQR